MERYPAELQATPIIVGPGLDEHRRGIILSWGERFCNPALSEEGLLKVMWYVCHSALENQTIRNNGLVVIHNNLILSAKTKPSSKLLKRYFDFVLNRMPVKIGACHVYAPSSSFWDKLVAKVKYILGKRARLRYVVHRVRGDNDLEGIGARRISSFRELLSRSDRRAEEHGSIEHREANKHAEICLMFIQPPSG